MGRGANRDPHDHVEAQLRMRLLRGDQVPVVRRVEDPAVDPNSHYGRIWPEPSTTYL